MIRRAVLVSVALISFALVIHSVLADDAPPPKSSFSLTIYSTADPATFDPQDYARQKLLGNVQPLPGYGVVREIRKIDLAIGENTLKFTDVAAGIDPTTVAFRSLTAPGTTTVLEQSYEYDLVSPDKLLEKYIGQQVIINRRQPPLRDDKSHQPETIEGRLLSYDVNTFVLQTENKRLPVEMIPRTADITEIKLFERQTGLITKPTLIWKLSNEEPGAHDAQVTYQTDGLTWRADYTFIANADDSKVDVSSWVTLLNDSGATYTDAKLKLVAGDVHRLPRPEDGPRGGFGGGNSGLAAKADPQFVEKSFFEYHLYTLMRPTTIANASVKQIELFPTRANVPAKKIFVYYGVPMEQRYFIAPTPATDANLGTLSNKKVDIYLEISNTEQNGLGLALPAGRIRVYKKDVTDGANEFIGEDVITHTPKDEPLRVKLGSAFDVVGERKQTDFKIDEDHHVITEIFEIKLRNHKKEAITVLVKENLYRWANWEITKSSEKFEKQDSRTIQIPVEVPVDGEKKITYTVKYTW